MSLAKKIVKGVAFTGASSIINIIISFITLTVLARLLSPSDFGIMGMLTVVIGFITVVADLGLGSAVIRDQNVTHEQLSTLFFLNIIVGFILLGVTFFSSDIIAHFFKSSELSIYLKVISISFIIISLGQIFRTVLTKYMNFKALMRRIVWISCCQGNLIFTI